jgi:hypothetical protein
MPRPFRSQVGLQPDPLPVQSRNDSRAACQLSRSIRSSVRSSRRWVIASADRAPCVVAFRLDLALPSALRGPVDRSHGFTRCADARSDDSPAAVSR